MATIFGLAFFAFIILGIWFIVRQIRKAFRLRNLQLKDMEARERERRERP
jgi:flagellar biosynthesis/type III secretory pathway M-ring protein FliF/YscJ